MEGLFSENFSLGIACLENFFLVTAFLASVSSENIFLDFFQVNVFLENVLGRAFLERVFWESTFLNRVSESVLESFFLERVALGRVFDGMVSLERWDEEPVDEKGG